MNMVVSRPPGSMKHRPWANTQEVPHSVFSIDTVKSKVVLNVGTSGAYCCTEEIWARKTSIQHIICSFNSSAVFLDFEAREVPFLFCSVWTFLRVGKTQMLSSTHVMLTWRSKWMGTWPTSQNHSNNFKQDYLINNASSGLNMLTMSCGKYLFNMFSWCLQFLSHSVKAVQYLRF